MRVNGCCCMSLRVGGLVISVLGVLSLFFHFVVTVARIYSDSDIKIEDDAKRAEIVAIVLFAFYLPGAIVLGLLITGIVKNNHLLLLPWLVLKAIAIIISSLAIVIVLLYCLHYGLTDPRPMELDAYVITLFIVALISIGICDWFWIVIYSLYHQIRNERNKPLPSQMQLPYVESGSIGSTPPYQKFNNN